MCTDAGRLHCATLSLLSLLSVLVGFGEGPECLKNLTRAGYDRSGYYGGRPARSRVTHTTHKPRAYAAPTTARLAARVSKKALEAAAVSSVSASACITPAATAERWWTKKERVEVRAVPYTVPSVAPLRFASLASCASRRMCPGLPAAVVCAVRLWCCVARLACLVCFGVLRRARCLAVYRPCPVLSRPDVNVDNTISSSSFFFQPRTRRRVSCACVARLACLVCFGLRSAVNIPPQECYASVPCVVLGVSRCSVPVLSCPVLPSGCE